MWSLAIAASMLLMQPSLNAQEIAGNSDPASLIVYRLEAAPSQIFEDTRQMRRLAAQVERRSASILASGAIGDPAARREIFVARRTAALVRGKLAEAERFDRAATPSGSGTLGTELLIAALKAGRGGRGLSSDEAVRSAVRARLNRRGTGDRNQVIALRRELALASNAYRLGEIRGFADPAWHRNPEVGQDFAVALLRLWVEINLRNPHIALFESELGGWLSRHPADPTNIWVARDAPVDRQAAVPVTIAVWDAVDAEVFAPFLVAEAGETVNGIDDDADGFIDEAEGLAFDENFAPTSGTLWPLADPFRPSVHDYERYMRGLGDLAVGLESRDVDFATAWRRSLTSDGVVAFERGYGHYSQYSHGTRVADVALRRIERATLVPVRITFAYESPGPVLDEAAADRFVAMVETGARYMRQRGVRLCNISWGFTVRDIEDNLDQHGLEPDIAARSQRARAIFATMQAGMVRAMQSSPDILFVVSAGNSGQNIDYAGDLPGTINLPNVLTVGATDERGRVASFASTGESVDLFALGTNVEAMVPGGGRLRSSGASLAAPQVVNAAARLLAARPDLTSAAIAELLVQTATPVEGSALPLLHGRKAMAMLMGESSRHAGDDR